MEAQAAGRVYVGVNRLQGGTLGGFFRLTEGENRWDKTTAGLPDDCDVQTILVHPTLKDTIYVGTQDGPFRSSDAGLTWQQGEFPDRNVRIWSFLVDPANTNTIYAGAAPVALYRSDDNGDHWRRLPLPAFGARMDITFVNRIMRLGIHPDRPNEIFAVKEIDGVMRSRDGGESWTDCNDGLVRLSEEFPHLKSQALGPFDIEGMLDGHSLCVSPSQPGNVYAAMRMGVFQSTDGGETWQDLEIYRDKDYRYCRDVCFSPHDPNVVYAAVGGPAPTNTGGAIYRSVDKGKNWSRFDNGLEVKSTMMSVRPHRTDPNRIYGCARYGQVIGTQDGGKTWTAYPLPAGCTGVYSVDCN